MKRSIKSSGFTLIELLIAVAIIGILAGVAYPSYQSYATKSKRTEGQRELLRIASLMEQYYLDNRIYTNDMTKLGQAKDPFETEGGYYKIDATVTGDSFILTATAQGSLASADVKCKELKVTDAGKKTPSSDCWD
ncbi:type IV pilin protein [Thalassotalea euphylliae]|uniref:type IV pilin protein n=1 Tax=Thalassotalea euphylliae TaxID=1655234 RepID=UPI0015F249E8|nr:type IV pilin protein [Thalassotalea euphylliae]